MANFAQCLTYVLANEGGTSYLAGDGGEFTYKGIARAKQAQWTGWRIIDAHNLPPRSVMGYEAWCRACDKILNNDLPLQSLVSDFYEERYWIFGGLTSDGVAAKTMDLQVNEAGPGHVGAGITALQRAVLIQQAAVIVVDGAYGQQTEQAANSCDAATLLRDIPGLAWQHYQEIERLHPEDIQFDADWRRRTFQIPSFL